MKYLILFLDVEIMNKNLCKKIFSYYLEKFWNSYNFFKWAFAAVDYSEAILFTIHLKREN